MTRKEFTRKTRREALKRSGNLCEATGPEYGLEKGQRCNWPLSYGVEFDHRHTAREGGDNSLENCVACCRTCHSFKTPRDVKRIRKGDRIKDKHEGTYWKQSRPLDGTKASGIRKRFNGTVEDW